MVMSVPEYVPDMGKDGDVSGNSSKSPVMEAVRQGDVDSVRAFLEAGVDVNLSSQKTGRTLLHVACRQGCAEMVSLLLSKGANSGATTLRHLSPLHLACNQGHFKVSRLLLEAWAPVDDRDLAGTTPLHLSSQKGHADVVRLLLQCGADRNGLDGSGWTPLHYAASRGHVEVARILLQAGANAKAADEREKITPLHLSCASGHPGVAKVLFEFGADSSAMDSYGARPDDVIGVSNPGDVDLSRQRELSEIVVSHRKSRVASPSSLECVVDSLRAKVSELEDQLGRARRDHLEVLAYSADEHYRSFAAAVKPECVICLAEVKEVVLDPCRHLATCCNCAVALTSCPFCRCPVVGYESLENRRVHLRISDLENECTGLKTQLERFSNRVRDLVTENGQLKLDVRRAEADVALLRTERKALDIFIAQSSHALTLPYEDSSLRPPGVLVCDNRMDDSDCDIQEVLFSQPRRARNDNLGLNEGPHAEIGKFPGGGSIVRSLAPNTSSISKRVKDEKRGGAVLTGVVPDAIRNAQGYGQLGTGDDDLRPAGSWSLVTNERRPSLTVANACSTQSFIRPTKLNERGESRKDVGSTEEKSNAARDGVTSHTSNSVKISIAGATAICDRDKIKLDLRPVGTNGSIQEREIGRGDPYSRQDKNQAKSDSGMRQQGGGGCNSVAVDGAFGSAGDPVDHMIQSERVPDRFIIPLHNTKGSTSGFTPAQARANLQIVQRSDRCSIVCDKTANGGETTAETAGKGPVIPRAMPVPGVFIGSGRDRVETRDYPRKMSSGISEDIEDTAEAKAVDGGPSTDRSGSATGCNRYGNLARRSFGSVYSLIECHSEHNTASSASSSSEEISEGGRGNVGSHESTPRDEGYGRPSDRRIPSDGEGAALLPEPSSTRSDHGAGLANVGDRDQSASSRSQSPVALERLSSGKAPLPKRRVQ